jgi:type II secretory pathway pseudopilin PulG
MVVILIVAILAAVMIPIMRGRIDSAKWSEGKAMMGTISTAIRAYVAEKNANLDLATVTRDNLGFIDPDLSGTYFTYSAFSWVGTYTVSTGRLAYTITALAPLEIKYPKQVQLVYDSTGTPTTQWIEGAGGK